jgi:DNA-binding transcriptional regulator YhcF (GntR family)
MQNRRGDVDDLQLDIPNAAPIYMQIRNQVVFALADGRLKPGDRLPTIRALADESGINMMTVSKAYQLLKQEGYITADKHSGAVVSGRPAALSEKSLNSLRLILSEARLSGMTKDDVIGLCADLYDEMGM